MKTGALGKQGLVVSTLGLGCMGMSEFYGAGEETESIATIHRALDLGMTFLDTADMYGVGPARTPRAGDAGDQIRKCPGPGRRVPGCQRQAGVCESRLRRQPQAARRRSH